MNSEHSHMRKIVSRSLSGEGAHVPTRKILDGLNWKQAGTQPAGAPHTVFQLVQHVCFWQDWVLQWLDGKGPPLPRHASGSWPAPASPANAPEWKRVVKGFQTGLHQLESRSRTAGLASTAGQKSPLEMLQTIASHNSYHAGQVVAIRQLLGSWPPPSGGLTW
jgi:hypothetical protein